jgi:homoserine dehydrogenase
MFGKKDPSIDVAGSEAYNAIMILATEDLPLKERLSMAWLEEFSKVEENRLSREFQIRLRYIARFFPRDELAGDSINKLTPSEANALARRMVDFALDLEAMR